MVEFSKSGTRCYKIMKCVFISEILNRLDCLDLKVCILMFDVSGWSLLLLRLYISLISGNVPSFAQNADEITRQDDALERNLVELRTKLKKLESQRIP